jgi:hypothetical protein
VGTRVLCDALLHQLPEGCYFMNRKQQFAALGVYISADDREASKDSFLRSVAHRILEDMPDGILREQGRSAAIANDPDGPNWAAQIGKPAFKSIKEMVAALECDYERLAELRKQLTDAHESDSGDMPNCASPIREWLAYVAADETSEHQEDAQELGELEKAAGECESREDAEQHISEDPLSVEVRGDWHGIGEQEGLGEPVEFRILLGWGGPAVRIVGELNGSEPSSAKLEVQDWGRPWTEYTGADQDTLLTYCRQFYFGES